MSYRLLHNVWSRTSVSQTIRC